MRLQYAKEYTINNKTYSVKELSDDDFAILLWQKKIADEDIPYIINNVSDFCCIDTILNSKYVLLITENQMKKILEKYEKDIDWELFFENENINNEVIHKMLPYITEDSFFQNLINSDYLYSLSYKDLHYLTLYIDWEDYCNNIPENQISELLQYVSDVSLWNYILNSKFVKYVDINKHADTIHWRDFLNNADEENIKYLLNNCKAKNFWQYILHSSKISLLTPKQLKQKIVQYSSEINWYWLTQYVDFTEEDIEYFKIHINNKDFDHFIVEEYPTLLTSSEVVKYLCQCKSDVDWKHFKFEKYPQLTSADKDYLIATIPFLSAKNATVINNNKITVMENNHFYKFKEELERKGAFVVFRDKVYIDYEGRHNDIIIEVKKDFDLTNTEFDKLALIEERSFASIGELFNTEAQKKLEKKYNKESFKCAFGYIYVDNDGNTIAVIDADRIINYTPEEVKKFLYNQPFASKKIISVGISNNFEVSKTMFKLAKKRLIASKINTDTDYSKEVNQIINALPLNVIVSYLFSALKMTKNENTEQNIAIWKREIENINSFTIYKGLLKINFNTINSKIQQVLGYKLSYTDFVLMLKQATVDNSILNKARLLMEEFLTKDKYQCYFAEQDNLLGVKGINNEEILKVFGNIINEYSNYLYNHLINMEFTIKLTSKKDNEQKLEKFKNADTDFVLKYFENNIIMKHNVISDLCNYFDIKDYFSTTELFDKLWNKYDKTDLIPLLMSEWNKAIKILETKDLNFQYINNMNNLSSIKDNVNDNYYIETLDVQQRQCPFLYINGKIKWGANGGTHSEILKLQNSMREDINNKVKSKLNITSIGFGHYLEGVAVIETNTLENCTFDEVKQALLMQKKKKIVKVYEYNVSTKKMTRLSRIKY